MSWQKAARSFTVCAVLALMLVLQTDCGGRKAGIIDLSPSDSPTTAANDYATADGRTTALGQVIAEIDASAAPQGVSPALWDELTTELVRILRARRISAVVSTAPFGERNRVLDLTLVEAPGGGWQLEWTYLNVGDYNVDCLVGVSDITPIGQNFEVRDTDPNWDQARLADGNNDGMITVSDITPIGQNYDAMVSAYKIVGADSADGPWTDLGTVAFADNDGGAPPSFSFPLTTIEYTLYRVVPVDSSGTEGMPSVDLVTAGEVELSGTVVWDTGGPVEDATVGVRTVDQTEPVTVPTDASGAFSVMLMVQPLPSQILAEATYADPGTGLVLTNFKWTEEQTSAGEVTGIELILPNPAGKELTKVGDTAESADGSVKVTSLPGEVDRVFAQSYDPDLEPEVFPGEYADSDGIALESQVYLWVSSLDGAGQMVDDLSSPSDVKIEITPEQYPELWDVNPGNGQIDIPIFDLNYATGEWEEKGTGYLVDAAESVLTEDMQDDILDGIYTDPLWAVFEADHFSWYNCDRGYVGGIDISGVPRDKRQAVGEGATKAWDIITSEKGNEAYKKWNKSGNPDLKNEIGEEDSSGDWSPRKGGVKALYRQDKDASGNDDNSAWASYHGRKYTWNGTKWVLSVSKAGKSFIRLNRGLIEQRMTMSGTISDYDRRVRRFFLGITMCHEITHMKSLVYGGNVEISAASSSGVNCEGYQWTRDLFKGVFTLDSDRKLYFRSSDPANPNYNKWKEVTLEELKTKYCNKDSDVYKSGSSSESRSLSDVGFSGLSLEIATEVSDYGLEDPIVCDVTFSNTGSEDLVLPEVSETFLNPLIFYIEDQDGDQMPWLEPIEYKMIDPDSEITIPPAGSETYEFTLKYYDEYSELHNYGIAGAGEYDIYAYYNQAIPPWDGVISNTITITVDVNLPPEITAVAPIIGSPGTERTFTGTTTYPYVDSWSWDFGGGATPNTSSEQFPTVTMGALGIYSASVTATNVVGADTFNFELKVAELPQWGGFGNEATRTSQTYVTGAQTNHLEWSFIGLGGWGDDIASSAAIAYDGTVYVGADDGKLIALNPDGSFKWEYQTDYAVRSSPAIDVDGNVYFGSNDGSVYALNPSGGLEWEYPTGDGVKSSPTIGPDGTIYVGSLNGNLYALNPDGSLKWSYPTSGAIRSSPAIGPDGTVYFGGGSYDYKIHAVNPDGSLKWEFDAGFAVATSPAIARDGTIYIAAYTDLYALSPEGEEIWTHDVRGDTWSSPAIGPDGTIYIGSGDGFVDAVLPDGTLYWSYEADGAVRGSPAVGGDGTVYVADYERTIHAINPDGSLLWERVTQNRFRSSPAIDAEGRVYVSNDDQLFVFSGNAVAEDAAPIVTGAVPVDGRPSTSRMFWASTMLDNVDSWDWDFGGGASPNTSSEAAPVVTLGSIGLYNASVTAINSHGSDTLDFDLTIGGFPQWQMEGFDAQHIGRSPYVGAQTNNVKWFFQNGTIGVAGNPAIAADGTVYFGDANDAYAVTPDGIEDWSYTTGAYIPASPAIALDGTVYFASRDNSLYALDPDGSFSWSYATGNPIWCSPTIGSDGTVYFGSGDHSLYALSPAGTLDWSYEADYAIEASPALGADGTVYFAYYGSMFALNPNGVLQWYWHDDSWGNVTSPVIAPGGTVYLACNGLIAFSPNGQMQWANTEFEEALNSPALGADGSIYLGCDDFNFYAVNPDGSVKWNYPYGGPAYFNSAPAVGADGTVYFGGEDDFVYALNPDGSLLWSYETDENVDASPSISADGRVYIGSNDDKLYCFAPGS